jgi:glycosyltransferase 2 family protein
VLIVGLVFAGKLATNWQAVHMSELHWNFPGVIIAFVLLMVLQNLFVSGWIIIVRGMGLPLSWKRAFVIYNKSQAMRFIPGNVWHVVGRAYMAAEDGLPMSSVVASVFMENALLLVTAIAVFALALPFWAPRGQVTLIRCLLLVPPFVAVMYPPVLNRLLNIVLRTLRKPEIDLHMSYPMVLSAAAYHCMLRICSGACIFLIATAVYPLPVETMPAVIGMHALSFVIGVVSFITPAGLGFREAALAYFLRIYMPLPDAIMISLFARLLGTASEMAMAGLATALGSSKAFAAHRPHPSAPALDTLETEVEQQIV